MRQYKSSLGGSVVHIAAPRAGEFNRQAFDAWRSRETLLGLDVETTAITKLGHNDPDFRIRLIQFGGRNSAWVLNPRDPEQLRAAVETLSDESAHFVSHTKYDALAVYAQWGIVIEQRLTDTHVLARMASPAESAKTDLKTLAVQHGMPELKDADTAVDALFLEMYKAAHFHPTTGKPLTGTIAKRQEYGWNNVSEDDETYLVYAGLDAIACRRLANILVSASRNPRHILESEHWLSAQSVRIVREGMRLDADWTRNLQRTAQSALDECSAEADGYGAPSLNSSKLATWLGEHGADLSVLPRTKAGAPSLAKMKGAGDDSSAAVLLLDQDLPGDVRRVAELKVEYTRHKYAAQRAQDFLDRLTPAGRIHPVLNTIEAVTSRMSSTAPNMQNLPKSGPLRGCVLADEGKVLVSIDFEQVELRVVAALAREPKMIEAIMRGDSLHMLTCNEMGLIPAGASKKDYLREYGIGKAANFLICYGGGAGAMHSQLGIPMDEAAVHVRNWKEVYSQIDVLARRLGRAPDGGENRQGVRTGSYRFVPTTSYWKNGQLEWRTYALINYMIQSTARDLLVYAWRRLEEKYGIADCVLLPVHDELVCQVPRDQVEEYCRMLEDCMTFNFRGVPITATADVMLDDDGVSRWKLV
jgi:DNA polymerase-1